MERKWQLSQLKVFGKALLWGIFICLSWGYFPQQVHAEDWEVRDRGRRQVEVLQRFQKIVEANPTHGFAFKRMVQLAKKSPGLDRLISQYKRKVRRSPKRLNYRLILGHLYRVTKQKLLAQKEYEIARKYHPRSFLAGIHLSKLYQQQNKNKQAFESYQKTLPLARSKSKKKRCLKAMGSLALLLKKPKKALAYWKSFLALSPKNLQAREEVARVMARHKLYSEALAQWKKILQKTPKGAKRSRVLKIVGDLNEQIGKWQVAVKLYRQSMSYTNRGHWLRRELGEKILQLHRENGQLKKLVAHLKKKKKSSAEYAMYARLLDELGNNKEAVKAYQKALKQNPKETRLRLKYITLLEVLNKSKEAIRQYKLLIRFSPQEPRHRLAFAEMLSRFGKPKESMLEMKKLARSFSRNTEILGKLARLYKRKRMDNQALSLYKRLIRLEPKIPSHRRDLGLYYKELGKPKKANSTWKSILRSGIPSHKAASILGQIYQENGQFGAARKWIKRASNLQPRSFGYLMQVGELYQRILNEKKKLSDAWLSDAIRVWKRIYRKSKGRKHKKRAMQQLFGFYLAQGTLYKLPISYRQRIQQNPRDINALRSLAEYELWSAKRKRRRGSMQARRLFKQILNIKPNDLDSMLALEQLAVNRRDWHKARLLLLKVLKVNKVGRRNYYRRICNYSLKMKAYKEAIHYGRKAIELNPEDPSAHADLARILRKSGKPVQAIAAYQEAIRIRPKSYGYHQALAALMRQLQRDTEAIELYRHVLKHASDSQAIYDSALRLIDILLPKGKAILLERDLLSLSEKNARELSYFKALAALYKRQGRMDAYRIAYLKAAATVDQKSQVYKQLAQVAQEQGNLKKAIIYSQKMLEETSNPSTSSQLKLAKMYLQIGNLVSARKLLLILLNDNPSSLRLLREIAQLFYRHNLNKEAIRAYELFLGLEPSSKHIRIRLAALYQKAQEFETAKGLLQSVVWGRVDIPIRKVRKKKNRKKGNKKRQPYYFRKRRKRRYRRSYDPRQRQALEQLVSLHEKLKQLNSWDRRVLFELERVHSRKRERLINSLIKVYQQRHWYDRLQQILETAHRSSPEQGYWLEQLARIYQKQRLYKKAFATYTKLQKESPATRNRYTFNKAELSLAMQDKTRARYLFREYLHNNLSVKAQNRVTSLLTKTKNYELMFEILRSGVSEQHLSGSNLQALLKGYLQTGRNKEARELLWKKWFKHDSTRKKSNLQSRLFQRKKLLEQMWPLLDSEQRKQLQTHTRKNLMRSLLQNKESKTRFALVDMYTMQLIAKGPIAAQIYLPALWGIAQKRTSSDQRFRQKVMQELLQQGNYKTVTLLLRQSLSRQPNDQKRLEYFNKLLQGLPKHSLAPPRSFSRSLERELLQLRGQVSELFWGWIALRLGKKYLDWGDYRRVVWWLERYRWIGGKKARNNRELLTLLARAYKQKGSIAQSNKYYKQVLDRIWKEFKKSPSLKESLSKRQIQHIMLRNGRLNKKMYRKIRYRMNRSYKYRLRYRRMRRYTKRMNQYRIRHGVTQVYKTFDEAGKRKLFFKKLHALYQKSLNQSQREKRKSFLLYSYKLDWVKYPSHSSRQTFLRLLQEMVKGKKFAENRTTYFQIAQLQKEKGEYQKAILIYQKLLKGSKRGNKQKVLQRIAALYGSWGKSQKQMKAHLQLSTLHRRSASSRWLASYYLEKQQISEAIRYYRQYLQQSRRYRYGRNSSYQQLRNHIALAEFLMPSGDKKRILYYLQRASNALRQLPQKSQRYRRYYMQKLTNSLLHIGQLRILAKQWEQKRKTQPKDFHLLSQLRSAYSTLEEPKKLLKINEQMLTLQPFNDKLFRSLMNSYRSLGKSKQALLFLTKTYKTQNSKPMSYYLWMGYLYQNLQQPKKSLRYWLKQFDYCQKGTTTTHQFLCRLKVADTLLSANETEEAIKKYKQALNTSRKIFDWRLQVSLKKLQQKKVYSVIPKLIKKAMGESFPSKLRAKHISYIGYLIHAHRQLKEKKKEQKWLNFLSTANYQQPYTIRAAAKQLERFDRNLDAELLYWKAKKKSLRSSNRKASQRELCSYWQRRGLQQLCNAKQQELNYKQQEKLALKLNQKGLPFLAMLLIRKHWLQHPHQANRVALLAQLASRSGREQEALEFLQKLKQIKPQHSLLKEALPAQAEKRLTSSMLSRYSWNPIYIPARCKELQVKHGKLLAKKCEKKPLRCVRRIARTQKVLITNDCMGRFIGLDLSTGKVSWIHQMKKYKKLYPNQTTDKLQSNQSIWIRRFYTVQDIKVIHGDFFAVVNETWQENGKRWLSGFHHRLHFIKLQATTGKRIEHKSLLDDFTSSKVKIKKDQLSFYGRTFRVISQKTGKTLWRNGQLGTYSSWSYGSRNVREHITLDDGYLFAGDNHTILRTDRRGKLLWKRKYKWKVHNLSSYKQDVYVLLQNNQLLSIDARSGKKRWKQTLHGGSEIRYLTWRLGYNYRYRARTTLTSSEAQLFSLSSDGYLRALSRKSGKLLWKKKVGDHGLHPPQLSSDHRYIATIGQEGSLSVYRVKDGQLQWKHLFGSQSRANGYTYQRRVSPSHTRPIVGKEKLLLGAHDHSGHFAIYSFWQKQKTLEEKVKPLSTLLDKFKQERNKRLYHRLLSQAVDRYDSAFRKHFLYLSKQKRLSTTQRLRWAYSYLATGDDLKSDLQKILPHLNDLPKNQFDYSTHRLAQSRKEINIIQLLLLTFNSRTMNHNQAKKLWYSLLTRSRGKRMFSLLSPLGRRVASLFLSHKNASIRGYAAYSLALWGDQEAREPLLDFIKKKIPNSTNHEQKIQRKSIKLLINWNFYGNWNGFLQPSDLEKLQALLSKQTPMLTRLLAATFTGRIILTSHHYQKYDTKQLRDILLIGSQQTQTPTQFAVMAAKTLGQLGDRRGVIQMRRLFEQKSGRWRNQIAQTLFYSFDDYWGQTSMLSTFAQNHTLNIQLPAFRLIHAQRLLRVKQSKEAFIQLQLVMRSPKRLLTKQHQVLATYGMGRYFYRTQKYKQAKRKFEQTLKLDPIHHSALSFLARTLFALKDYPQAQKVLTSLLRKSPSREYERKLLAILYLNKGFVAKADKLFQTQYKKEPRWASGYFLHAGAYMESAKPNPKKALALVQKALKLSPQTPQFLALKAKILHSLGQKKKAKKSLKEAIKQEAPLSPYRKRFIKQYNKWF